MSKTTIVVTPYIVLFLLLVATLTCMENAVAATPATAPAQKIAVAIIEPEVLTDLPPQEREALAGGLDTLLTECITKLDGLVLVDRQALDRLVQERALAVGGLTKMAPGDVAEVLHPFWSAGVLICSQVDAKAKVVIVEAVSAQTGQLLSAIYLKPKDITAVVVQKAIGDHLEAFLDTLSLQLQQIHQRIFIEVSGRLVSRLERSQTLLDQATDFAQSRISLNPSLQLLVPRQPLNTREERLLRVLGLAQPSGGDAAAGLRATPDQTLEVVVTEKPDAGITYDDTPVELTLRIAQQSTTIHTTKNQFFACLNSDAKQWLDDALASITGRAVTGDDTAQAAELARQTLRAVQAWKTDSGYELENARPNIRVRILSTAMRAAHLDPTNEEAAYLVACCVDVLYRREGKDNSEMSFAAIDRCIAETQRYLDRFKQADVEHHRTLLNRLGLLGVFGEWKINKGPGRHDDLQRPPDVRLYPYARIQVRAWAEYGYLGNVDQRYGGSNSFSAFSFNLLSRLIPCIPEDRLNEEHEYWRTFYTTKVEPIMQKKQLTDFLNQRPVPWPMIDATFQARKKNPQAVRADLQVLAREFPRSQTHMWGGDQWTPSQIPMLLQVAGDAEWRTWQPDFGSVKLDKQISYPEMTAFMNALRPRFPSPIPVGPDPQAPSIKFVVPEAVRNVGLQSGSIRPSEEVLLLVDGEAWLSLPGPWADASPLSRIPSVLYRALMPDVHSKEIRLSPVPLPWPERPKDDPLEKNDKCRIYTQFVQAASAGSTVWIGTDQGVVRYDHSPEGMWNGRWYTVRDGLPCQAIRSIAPAKLGKRNVLLMTGWTTSSGSNTHVFALDPKTSQCTILFDGTRQDKRLAYSPAARLRDGRLVLVQLLGQGAYGNVNLEDIVEFTQEGSSYGQVATVVDGATGKASIWEGQWEGQELKNYLWDISATSAKHEHQAFRSERITVFPFEDVGEFFGEIRFDDPSGYLNKSLYFYTTFMVGAGDTLWIAGADSSNPSQTLRIFGYRPGTRTKPLPPTGIVLAANAGTADLWIGPFSSPDGTAITNLQSVDAQHLLVTTQQASYLLSCSDLMDAAIKNGRACEADLLASRVDARLDVTGWQAQVPALILRQQWDDALALLDQRQHAIGGEDNEERVRLLLWRANVLARMHGGLNKSIDLYRTIAETTSYPRCAKVFARMNELFLLYKANRYQEMLALVDQVAREFPQVNNNGSNDSLNWYIADARKNLAAQSKQPAETHGENK